MNGTIKAKALRDAQNNKKVIRCTDRFNPGWFHGYVLAVGAKEFLIAIVDDAMRLNGFECHQISNIKTIKPDPYAAFVEAALRARTLKPPRKAPIAGDSIRTWLPNANTAFPLVTIHVERIKSDVCYIGRIVSMADDVLQLQKIEPGAKWYRTTERFRWKDITRIGFGQAYESALHLVGGNPPRLT
jgi:hypothetical protein